MSPGLKSMVTAFGPVLNTVMRPLPLIQYCHSSAFGCQCISRMPPGRTVTSAAAILVETMKLLLSAIRTSPPSDCLVGVDDPSLKIKGWGGTPPVLLTAARSDARSPGSVPWKIQRFCSGMLANVSAGTPKFLASTSGGVWANQSVTSSVLNSLASPSSKQITNSQPSGPSPCNECGWPAGKYHRSPSLTSATYGRPSASRTVTRQLPYVMIAHSAAWCQCNSLMPPAVNRMLTPAIVSEIAKSFCVTSRAQPPFCTRFGALLNEAQSIGMPPTSVGGGNCADGNCLARASLCGPGSLRFPGPLALMAPCGGRSGLPKEAALAALAVTAPAADTTRTSRLENIILSYPTST